MRRDYKFEQKILIASIILSLTVTFFALVQVKNALYKMEYDKIYNRTKRVYNTLEYLNNQVEKGTITKKEAQQEALTILEHYTYSEDSGYIWVGDYNMNIVMHPHFKTGVNIADIDSDCDKEAFKSLITVALKDKSKTNSGTVIEHKWKKQKDDNNRTYTKRSIAIKYDPWGWIIGTGTYSDTTEKAFAKFTWYVFATYLIFFVFIIFFLSYLKNKSIEKLISAIQFVAWYKNAKGEYVSVNKHLLKISPYSKEEDLIGKHYFEDASDEFMALVKAEDDHVINTGEMVYAEREIEILGETCVVQIFKVPIYDIAGKVVGIAGMHRDVTEEKKVEKVQKEFISVVSHELRTPLTSIIGSIQLILSLFKEDLTERVKNLLVMTDKNSIRLKKLVDNILDTSKLDSGKLAFNKVDTDLIPLLNESVSELSPYAIQYEVNLSLKNNIEEVYAHIDKERFKQIVSNLVSNAIKFSKKGSNVDIETAIVDSKVRISVINYESLIPEEKIENLFKKFTQVDPADTRSYGGTGLGLYITKQLVENMDGEIGVDSNEKRTIFYVTFNLLKCDFDTNIG